jgi:hypothetical protein
MAGTGAIKGMQNAKRCTKSKKRRSCSYDGGVIAVIARSAATTQSLPGN